MKRMPSSSRIACPLRGRIGPCVVLILVAGLLAGCAAPHPARQEAPDLTGLRVYGSLDETPPPDGPWRPHIVSWCPAEPPVPASVEALLELCSTYFREGSGVDSILELEMALEAGSRHPLLLMTLGQLYLMAGQGDPDLLPLEGPVADVGDWSRNRQRLLGRAEELLTEAGEQRPWDAAVDYLLADVWRARENFPRAEAFVFQGAAKSTSGRGFALLVLYQQLYRHPGKYQGGPGPEYPADALGRGLTGDVVLDLLISPLGEVRQAVVVAGPAEDLARAAAASLVEGYWEPATIGKYPIWSWLRVKTSFQLEP
ncbi:hypothetical protein CSB20_06160 [bacterium DOLZORAL124_64_63]|nr:MAG: hypothetical protein CSB20_06160 [bacterium DOLZORAL124_64_63]